MKVKLILWVIVLVIVNVLFSLNDAKLKRDIDDLEVTLQYGNSIYQQNVTELENVETNLGLLRKRYFELEHAKEWLISPHSAKVDREKKKYFDDLVVLFQGIGVENARDMLLKRFVDAGVYKGYMFYISKAGVGGNKKHSNIARQILQENDEYDIKILYSLPENSNIGTNEYIYQSDLVIPSKIVMAKVRLEEFLTTMGDVFPIK